MPRSAAWRERVSCRAGPLGPRTDRDAVLAWLDAALATSGSIQGARLLVMLEQRGRPTQLGRLLANLARAAGDRIAHACAPVVTGKAFDEASADLHDFRVIEPRGTSFTSRPLLAAERADLTYFLLAIETDRGPPRPLVSPGEPPPKLVEAIRAVDATGSFQGGHDYLRARGVDLLGPAPPWGSLSLWPAEILAGVGRELELHGTYDAAARLYRGALGAAGDDVSGDHWAHRALGRVADASPSCRETIAIRMFRPTTDGSALRRLDGLARRGIDVERLFRGAALTTDRRDLASRAPTFLDGASLATVRARHARWGDEAWVDRLRVLPTLGNVAPDIALPLLIRRAALGPSDVRVPAVQILAALVARPRLSPCRKRGDLGPLDVAVTADEAFPPIGPAEDACDFRLSTAQLKELAGVVDLSSTANDERLREAGERLRQALKKRVSNDVPGLPIDAH